MWTSWTAESQAEVETLAFKLSSVMMLGVDRNSVLKKIASWLIGVLTCEVPFDIETSQNQVGEPITLTGEHPVLESTARCKHVQNENQKKQLHYENHNNMVRML